MELRAYWAIIWRRIWLVALVVVVVALYVGYQGYHLWKTPGALTAYRSSITVQIGLRPTPNSNYATDLAIAEDLAQTLVSGPVLTSKEFETAVSQQIEADLPTISARYGANPDLGDWRNPASIGEALTANRVNNLVTIDVAWATQPGAWAVASATGEVLATKLDTFLDYVVTDNPQHTQSGGSLAPVVSARVVSGVSDPASGPGFEEGKLGILLLVLLVGLIVGIALAFLVDYLDDHVRSREDVADLLQVPVYAELPRAPAAGARRMRSAARS